MNSQDKRLVRVYFRRPEQDALKNIRTMLSDQGNENTESAALRYAVRRVEKIMKNDPNFGGF